MDEGPGKQCTRASLRTHRGFACRELQPLRCGGLCNSEVVIEPYARSAFSWSLVSRPRGGKMRGRGKGEERQRLPARGGQGGWTPVYFYCRAEGSATPAPTWSAVRQCERDPRCRGKKRDNGAPGRVLFLFVGIIPWSFGEMRRKSGGGWSRGLLANRNGARRWPPRSVVDMRRGLDERWPLLSLRLVRTKSDGGNH